MNYNVSILIAAFKAEHFIARAVASALAQQDVRAQIIIAADDEADYLRILKARGRDCKHIAQYRTAKRQSGPAAARNLAAAHAQAPVLATLDADDAYCPGRLAKLVPAALEHGAATGETIERADGVTERRGRPLQPRAHLTLDDICRLHMPIAPVFRRELLGKGWPELAFAEDMVFNAGLAVRAERYAFIEDAGYLYHRRNGSLTEDDATLERALRGYHQILTYLESVDWPPTARVTLREVIEEDIAMVETARGKKIGQSWRQAWADWQGRTG